MAFYSYLSTKIIMAFITKSYQNLFGVRSYINAYYFMLGDNIHHSLDSRHWGLVPDDFIVGVVQWIWFSKDEEQNSIRWNRIGRVD